MENLHPLFVILYVVAMLSLSLFISLAYLRWLHKVRGGIYRKEAKTSALLMFTTKFGDYRVSSDHRQLSFKARGFTEWETTHFDDIVSLYQDRTSDTASIREFFLGGFTLTDFFQKYRDRVNYRSIKLKVRNGEDIPLVTLSQYEQREWFIGQLTHDLKIYILKKLGWYDELDERSQTWLTFFYEKLKAYDKGLRLKQ